MTPSRGASRRSGDPRRRTGTGSGSASAPGAGSDRRWAVVVAVAVGGAVVVLALLTLRPDDRAPDGGPGGSSAGDVNAGDPRALTHAEAACDLTGKAADAVESAQVDARERVAAALLLLDRAIIESARAAESDTAFTALDDALRATHLAGHEGDPERWQATFNAALAECEGALD